VRSDGSDLHRLLSREEITSLPEDDIPLILDHIAWLPNQHQLVFNTQQLIDGPHGYQYDLYLLDIAGELTKLAGPGEGGEFYPSPNGRYIASAQPSRIGLFDLDTGTYTTLMEVDPYRGPIGPPRSPILFWDKNSQFITTSLLPKNVYYPYMYEGEPEQIWRLGIDGQTELIVEVNPHPGFGSAVRFSPHADYYFYLEAEPCLDGYASILHLRSLPTGEEILEIPCTFETPEWSPDGESFLYREEGKWMLVNVSDTQHKHLAFLDVPIDVVDYPSVTIHWIDDFYYLEKVKYSDGCFVYLGSLDGIITEIIHTYSSNCPDISFSVSN
jgi:Tol biopolymer transport system component